MEAGASRDCCWLLILPNWSPAAHHLKDHHSRHEFGLERNMSFIQGPTTWGDGGLLSECQLWGSAWPKDFLKRFNVVNQEREHSDLQPVLVTCRLHNANYKHDLSGWWLYEGVRFFFRDVQRHSVLSPKEGKVYRYTEQGQSNHLYDLKERKTFLLHQLLGKSESLSSSRSLVLKTSGLQISK